MKKIFVYIALIVVIYIFASWLDEYVITYDSKIWNHAPCAYAIGSAIENGSEELVSKNANVETKKQAFDELLKLSSSNDDSKKIKSVIKNDKWKVFLNEKKSLDENWPLFGFMLPDLEIDKPFSKFSQEQLCEKRVVFVVSIDGQINHFDSIQLFLDFYPALTNCSTRVISK